MPANITHVNRDPRLITILLGLWLFSCSGPERPPNSSPLRATDDLGHVVTLAGPPQRIVSLAPSLTETLFALELDSAVVGVTDYCDYPPEARLRPRIGGIRNPVTEAIVKLRPDLVLMSGSGNLQSDFARLTELGLTVFVSHPRDLQGIYKSIADIAALTGRTARADSLIAGLKAEEERLRDRAAKQPTRSVLFLVSVHPAISVGPGTFIDEMIRLCNGRNIASSARTAYPLMSREEILAADPDRIVVTSDVADDPEHVAAAFSEWRGLGAIVDTAITLVDANTLTRPGPRIIEGLQELYRAIHNPRAAH